MASVMSDKYDIAQFLEPCHYEEIKKMSLLDTIKHEKYIYLKISTMSFHLFQASDAQKIMTIPLKNTPIFEVCSISISPCQRYVLLVGTDGIAVVNVNLSNELSPTKYSDQNNGRCRLVGDHLFSKYSSDTVLQVRWLPTNLFGDYSCFCALSSDNKLRVFDASAPSQPLHVINLSSNSLSSSISHALNECAVCFDIGFTGTSSGHLLLYILLGSGDILTVNLMYKHIIDDWISEVSEPLVMLPGGDVANFGQDHCALLCLPGTPELLISCTTMGMIYHFLVLHNTDNQEVQLHLFDQVELELTIRNNNSELNETSIDNDPYSSSIQLYRDSLSATRYLCFHDAGCHSVTVNWHRQVQHNTGGVNWDESQVRHVICTLPVAANDATVGQPLIGHIVLPGLRSASHLLCVTSSGELLSVQLGAARCEPPPGFLTGASVLSTSVQLQEEDDNFENMIKVLLKRDTTQPILRASPNTQLSEAEALALLNGSICRLREHVDRLSRARTELTSRRKLLCRRADMLKQEIAAVQKMLQMDSVKQLDKKLKQVTQQRDALTNRLETVSRRVNSIHHANLTAAERSVVSQLEVMRRKLKDERLEFERARDRVRLSEREDESEQSEMSELSSEQNGRICSSLKVDGLRLCELVTRVKCLRDDLH